MVVVIATDITRNAFSLSLARGRERDRETEGAREKERKPSKHTERGNTTLPNHEQASLHCKAVGGESQTIPKLVETSPNLAHANMKSVEAGLISTATNPKLVETQPNLVETSRKLDQVGRKHTSVGRYQPISANGRPNLVESGQIVFESNPNSSDLGQNWPHATQT